MAPRRKTISVSILDIKDAGTSAQKDYRTNFKSGKTDEMLPLNHAIHIDGRIAGTGKDVNVPKDLSPNAISFCYPIVNNPDCVGLGEAPGTVFDFNTLGSQYRTQLFSRYRESALFYRSQNGDNGGSWNPWLRVYDTGNPPTAMDVGSDTRYWGRSDYANGTLISTEIVANTEVGVSFTIDILAKTYSDGGTSTPLNIVAEGYLYNNTFISNSCVVHGAPFTGPLTFLKLPSGKLGIWFPRQGYWKNYGVTVYDTVNTGYKKNLVTDITDSVKPGSDKTVDVPVQYTYGTYRKPSADDVGLGLVPNKEHTTSQTPNTVPVRDDSADLHARLFRSYFANETYMNGALAFRVNNSTDNYIRFCSDTEAIRNWLGVPVNYSSSSWAGIINRVPYVTSSGVLEVGKYIDMRDTNSTADFDVRLICGSANFNVQTAHGTIEIGARNTSYAHIYTDRPVFAFNHGICLTTTDSTRWLDMRTSSNCFTTLGSVANSSASAIVRQEHADRHWILGGLGNNQFGIYMINKSRTTNGTDSSAYLTWDGDWNVSRNGYFNDVYIRSDIRDKDNIRFIDNSLARVKEMCGVLYDVRSHIIWNGSGGLISQQVQKGLPEAVSLDKNFEGKVRQRVNYNAVVGLLVNCVNDLETKLEVMSSKFEKLYEAHYGTTS